MRTLGVIVAGVMLAVSGCGEKPPADVPSVTADDVSRMMAGADDDIRTYALDMKATMSLGAGTLEVRGTETTQYCRTDGKVVVRSHRKSVLTTHGRSGPATRVSHRSINTGTALWKEVTPPSGGVRVTKHRADITDGMGLAASQQLHEEFDVWRRTFNLEVTGRAEIDGEACYVLEGVHDAEPADNDVRAADAAPRMRRVRMYYAQSDLMLRRQEGFDAEGKRMLLIEMTHVRLNPDVDETLFEYVPPLGAQVRDLTGG